MTIISGLHRQRHGSEMYPLANYCKDSYQAYKSAIETIVNSSKDFEDIEMVEFPIRENGPQGEPLSIMAVRRGYDSPKNVVIRFSGSHGIEGYIGAAGQLYEVESTFHMNHDNLIIEIFGYNIWGVCNLRRSSCKNYDYNFTHFSKSTSDLDEFYQESELLKPQKSKKSLSLPLLKKKKAKGKIEKATLKSLLEKGQSKHANGLFYNGGESLDEGAEVLFSWLEGHLKMAENLVCIDVHSEPGTWCHEDLKIFDYENTLPKDSISALFGRKADLIVGEEALNGDVCSKVFEVVKKANQSAEVIGIRQSIETYSINEVIPALVNENIAYMELAKFGKKIPHDHIYKQQLLKYFYPDDLEWRHRAVDNLQQLFQRCIKYVNIDKSIS